jgi:hypothetical protein
MRYTVTSLKAGYLDEKRRRRLHLQAVLPAKFQKPEALTVLFWSST